MKSMLVGFAVCVLGLPAFSHEFWISPEAYVIPSGGKVQAHLRVGEKFTGAGYSYQSRQIDRFDLVMDGNATEVKGRLGDVPAMAMSAPADGLAIIVHETTDNQLTYKSWEKFKKFVSHKDFSGVLDDHVARGIRQEDFIELYRRYAKSLVAIGDGNGKDMPVGLKTEIVALANPYTDDIETMPVEVLLDGVPRANAQVELFVRDPGGDVEVQLYRTNDEGRAEFPVAAGHEYLVDAVVLEALHNNNPDDGPVWWSHWASLTFAVPE